MGFGSVLSQMAEDKKFHPIQYAGSTMTKVERNYEACEREALAVVFVIRYFRVYMLSTEPFTLISDHKSLKDGLKKKDLHRQLAKWLGFFSEYKFTVHYKPGKGNVADEACDEGEIGLFDGIIGRNEPVVKEGSFEHLLTDVTRYLAGKTFQEVTRRHGD